MSGSRIVEDFDTHHTPHLIIEYLGEDGPHVGAELSLIFSSPNETKSRLKASTRVQLIPEITNAAKTSVANREWVQLSNPNNSELFGTKNYPPLFKNLYFNELSDVRKICPVEKLSVADIRSINKNSHAILYVILEDGTLVLVNESGHLQTHYGKGRPVSIKHGEVTHVTNIYDVAKKKPNWRLAVAAGEVWVQNGSITKITNASGGFLPTGEHLKEVVEHVFRKNGYSEVRNIFSYDTPGWFLANQPIIDNSLLLRMNQLTSSFYIPQHYIRPVTFPEFQQLSYTQQPNLLKRLFNIPVPGSEVSITREIADELARKEFWRARNISVSSSNLANKNVVADFFKPLAPYAPYIGLGAALGIETYREFQIQPNGHYFHDALLKFTIDVACFNVVFVALGRYAIPVILTASMPDLTEAHDQACERSYAFNPRTAGEFLWQSDMDERAYELGFANGMRKLARGLLSPFSRASAEMKQKLVDDGVIAGKKSPEWYFTPAGMAAFKASLDTNRPVTTWGWQDINFNSYIPIYNSATPDLTQVPWSELGPKKLSTETAQVVFAQPTRIVSQDLGKPFYFNPIPENKSQFRFDPNSASINVDFNLANLGASVVSVGTGAPIVAIAAAVYDWAEQSFKKKGRAYYKKVREASISAHTKLNEFNNKLGEIKALPSPKNATEMLQRATEWRELIDLLEKTKEAFKTLRDLTDVEHRHSTYSSFWGWYSLTDSEYNMVKGSHHDSKRLVGDKEEKTGLYATRSELWNKVTSLEAATPKQAILDETNQLAIAQDTAFNTLKDTINSFNADKISEADLWQKLVELINNGEKIKTTDYVNARSKLQNETTYTQGIDQNEAAITERNVKAAELVAGTFYNKYFINQDKKGQTIIDPAVALEVLKKLETYLTYAPVKTIADLMKNTLSNAFIDRCKLVDIDMIEHKRTLLECLVEVKLLQAEATKLTGIPEISNEIKQSLQKVLDSAKQETLNLFQTLIQENKVAEANLLLSSSLLSPEEQKELQTATERYLADKKQQKIELTLELGNQTIRAAHHALGIFAEWRQTKHKYSAPSIPTASMQRVHQSLWQTPAKRDQYGTDPLHPKREEPIRYKNVKL